MPRDGQRDDSAKVVLIVVGSVVGALALLALVCGGIFFFVTYTVVKTGEKVMEQAGEEMEKARQSQEALTAAEVFLNDVAANQPERAYRGTTRVFQGRQTLEQFRAYLGQHPSVTKPAFREWMMPLPRVVDDRVTLRATLAGNQATVVTLDMLKEDGRWKVDEFVAP
jgi:hypothetical protein